MFTGLSGMSLGKLDEFWAKRNRDRWCASRAHVTQSGVMKALQD